MWAYIISYYVTDPSTKSQRPFNMLPISIKYQLSLIVGIQSTKYVPHNITPSTNYEVFLII